MGKRLVIHRSPNRESTLIMLGTFGVTLWRRGAVSFQWRGHFLQVVLGDWWQARPDTVRRHQALTTHVRLDGRTIREEVVRFALRGGS